MDVKAVKGSLSNSVTVDSADSTLGVKLLHSLAASTLLSADNLKETQTKNMCVVLEGKQESLNLSWTKQASILSVSTDSVGRGGRLSSKHEGRGQTEDVLSIVRVRV